MTGYRPSVTQLHLQLSCNNSPDKRDIVAMTKLSWCIVLHYCLPVQYDIDDMATRVAMTVEAGGGGYPGEGKVGKWGVHLSNYLGKITFVCYARSMKIKKKKILAEIARLDTVLGTLNTMEYQQMHRDLQICHDSDTRMTYALRYQLKCILDGEYS